MHLFRILRSQATLREKIGAHAEFRHGRTLLVRILVTRVLTGGIEHLIDFFKCRPGASYRIFYQISMRLDVSAQKERVSDQRSVRPFLEPTRVGGVGSSNNPCSIASLGFLLVVRGAPSPMLRSLIICSLLFALPCARG
jgi:hypothetical protein